jgi:hypothetical protein
MRLQASVGGLIGIRRAMTPILFRSALWLGVISSTIRAIFAWIADHGRYACAGVPRSSSTRRRML